MVKNTAITKVFSGEMVRATSWDKDRYIITDSKTGTIIDNEGKPFNIMTAKEKKWEVYTKPKETAPVDNSKMYDMIKALSKQVEELQDTINRNDIDTDYIAETVEDRVIKALDGISNTTEINTDEVAETVEKTIKENIPQEDNNEETIKMFYGVSKLKDIRELFKDELTKCKEKKELLLVLTKYIPFCSMGGKKINTIRNSYTDLRNVIKEVGGEYEEYALDLFRIPSDAYERINSTSRKKAIENLSNKETFEISEIKAITNKLKSQIETVIKLDKNISVEKFKEYNLPIAKQQTVERARAYLYGTYLALVTGRRNIEIIKTLSLVEKKGVWFYKGVAKKESETEEIKAFSLDNDFPFLEKLINQIRKDVDTTKLTKQEVNSKYNHIFNRAFKRITGTNFTLHDAREIYAEIAYLDYLKENNLTDSEREEQNFKADILGHEIDKDRLIATDHYRTKKGGIND